ncbi:hypothetical protein P5673_028391 [Acropora cervicornis]|uniref:SAP domain-containing protein n=1 Tax=Acropora cervicornis TaxID=6130 RepID=A0AAD9PXG4_ACRCE|nr:hypothetical protein P5673_028391 [Acropora cervicornis]
MEFSSFQRMPVAPMLYFNTSAGDQAAMARDDPQRKTETRLCEKRSQTAHGMQSEEETNDASTEEAGSKSKSAGDQAAMAGDDPQRKTETRLCEKRSQTAHGMQSEEETNNASTEEPGSKSKSTGNQATMAGDDPPCKTETRLCEKRSQTGHGMQSEEETNDVSTEEPSSKSKVVQACLGAGERVSRLEIAEQANKRLVTHMENTCTRHQTPEAGKPGCGLGYLVPFIKEHYADENKRYNQLPTRLIGDQTISLGRYGYRLIDGLECADESPAQHLRTLALGRIVLYLRQACTLFNKVSTNKAEVLELKEYCQLYFNFYCLFFPSYVNVTTWTIAYAIPHHALKIYDKYRIGYGIISLQAKEAKHSGIKSDLALSNRSNKTDATGKWWQVMRANYIRSFYLPEHQPMPSCYSSHFKSRVPPHCNLEYYCSCGRKKEDNIDCCANCLESMEIVLCAQNKELSSKVLDILKPVKCSICKNQFADEVTLASHLASHGSQTQIKAVSKAPKDMKVDELKTELRARRLCTTGNKDILVRRLEGAIADEH